MRIVILSDSLGRPRPNLDESEKTRYYDVYAYLIKQHFSNDDVELFYVEDLDSDDAVFWSQRAVAFREPDIVIYQFGINDCAPRVFKKKSRSFLFNQFFRKITFDFFLIFIHRFRYIITRHRKKVYVPPERFSKNLEEMVREVKKYNQKACFIVISILYTNNKLTTRSFGINDNIKRYNSILEEIFEIGYIDINELDIENTLISDSIHLTKEAHLSLAKKIIKKVEEKEMKCNLDD